MVAKLKKNISIIFIEMIDFTTVSLNKIEKYFL